VTFNLANNDVESFNKEMASASLEWQVMQSPDEDWRCILASRVMKVNELHLGCFVA
jgi:predicted negative regulator of RcsB-dependent stress response